MKNLLTFLLMISPFLLMGQATTSITKETENEKKAQEQLLQGDVKMNTKKYAEAIDHYSNAIDLNGELICAYVYRAKAYLKLSKKMEACKDLKKAESLGCWRPELEGLIAECEK